MAAFTPKDLRGHVEGERLVPYRGLSAYGIRYCRLHLNRMVDKEQFPAPIWLGPNRKVWRLSDIERFLATRPTVRPPFPGSRSKAASDAAD
jgi:hypothetical protein